MKLQKNKIFSDLFLLAALATISLGLSIHFRSECSRLSTYESFVTKTDHPNRIPHPVLGIDELNKYLAQKDFLLIDVRTTESYDSGHIPGAISMPANNFSHQYDQMKHLLEPYRKKLIVVYCKSIFCNATDEAQEQLVSRGFEHVGVFADGMQQWHQSGLEIEK